MLIMELSSITKRFFNYFEVICLPPPLQVLLLSITDFLKTKINNSIILLFSTFVYKKTNNELKNNMYCNNYYRIGETFILKFKKL